MTMTPTTVIVIGSGLAGLASTVQLLAQRIPVLMLERSAKPGGNSIKASSGINGAPTRFQSLPNLDSVATFYADTATSAGAPFISAAGAEKTRREKLVETLTYNSGEAVSWLTDEQGVELSRVTRLGGHSVARTHRGAGKKTPGYDIVSALLKRVSEDDLFRMGTGRRVTKLLREKDGAVTGVEYTLVTESNETVVERAYGPVVVATGGFAGDARGLLAQYRPDLAGIPSTNEPREGTQPLLQEIGAAVVDMDRVQVHPTGFVDGADAEAAVKILAAEALRGEGGILVRGDGMRFVNELETREKVTGEAMRQADRLPTEATQWDVKLVLDQGAAAALETHLGFYMWKGLIRKTTVGEEMAGEMPALESTLRDYADVVAARKEDEFARESFGNWTLTDVTPESEVYVGKVTPVVHFTMGGVVINEHGQPLNYHGRPIPGLWAAGEITGGLHGQNRLGGSSLLECVVFGRIAGQEAAAFYRA